MFPTDNVCSWRLFLARRLQASHLVVYCFSSSLALAPKLVRLLEVAFIINLREFPAFRLAFEPAAVRWDIDPAPFIQRASEASEGVSERL